MVMTKKEVLRRIEGLGGNRKARVICALVGHSKIVGVCSGEVSCGRCGAVVGDTLAGCFDLAAHVLIGHNCPQCQANYKALDWTSKLAAPDPFRGKG